MYRHIVRCLLAGVVALLPLVGTVFAFAYLESSLSESWLRTKAFYFPGLGVLLAVLCLYLVGLFVTTFLGRLCVRGIDRMVRSLPLIGALYTTLKQILGYGEGQDALFHEVVLVPSTDTGGVQLGLVTEREAGGRCAVFVPSAPNPTNGRLVFIDQAQIVPIPGDVTTALKTLVSVGKGAALPR